MFAYYDVKSDRLRDNATGRFAPFNPSPDETCPYGCERFGDWWVPEDCSTHLGGGA